MKKFKPNRLDKVFWPKHKYTKGDMLAYYERVAPFILPHLKDRPVVLKRFPDGVSGVKFFQKNVKGDVPPFVRRVTIPAKTVKKNVHYIVCDNAQTLRFLANLGTVELHPWDSRVGNLGRPDFMVFDLDPGSNVTFDAVVELAHIVKDFLEKLGIKSFVKTSGKRGLHMYVPLGGKYTYVEVRTFARRVSNMISRMHPERATSKRGEENRHGKIFIDYLRNAVGQTAVAPYSLRAAPDATVSTPLAWSEVNRGLKPEVFTIKNALKRFSSEGDLFKPVLGKGVNLRAAEKQLAKLESE